MSERYKDTDNERKVALTILKLGGAVVTAATLATAAQWAARRLKFEHTAQRFTDDLLYLESEEVEHHHAIIRRVAAASLIRPAGLTKEQIRGLATQGRQGNLVGEALHNLTSRKLLESVTDQRQLLFRPTQDFMSMLVDEEQIETPKLLKAATEIYSEFTYDRLRAFITKPDVLDMSPLPNRD